MPRFRSILMLLVAIGCGGSPKPAAAPSPAPPAPAPTAAAPAPTGPTADGLTAAAAPCTEFANALAAVKAPEEYTLYQVTVQDQTGTQHIKPDPNAGPATADDGPKLKGRNQLCGATVEWEGMNPQYNGCAVNVFPDEAARTAYTSTLLPAAWHAHEIHEGRVRFVCEDKSAPPEWVAVGRAWVDKHK